MPQPQGRNPRRGERLLVPRLKIFGLRQLSLIMKRLRPYRLAHIQTHILLLALMSLLSPAASRPSPCGLGALAALVAGKHELAVVLAAAILKARCRSIPATSFTIMSPLVARLLPMRRF